VSSFDQYVLETSGQKDCLSHIFATYPNQNSWDFYVIQTLGRDNPVWSLFGFKTATYTAQNEFSCSIFPSLTQT
jgi:hypothetical protein